MITINMQILIACDKFKGSLTAVEVCESIADALTKRSKKYKCSAIPLADGGDGTMRLLQKSLNLQENRINTIDPLGREIDAQYYTLDTTAYIELAEISGILRLKPTELNPLITTTIGTGYVLKEAVKSGCDTIVLALGGSCTNDAGLGIAYALGYDFLDRDGKPLIPTGGNLREKVKIITPADEQRFNLTLLCDVTNPMYGPHGAAHMYAEQKGADSEQINILDEGLRHVSQLIKAQIGKDISEVKGGGAAGGIAAGLVALLDAQVLSGFEYYSHLIGLEKLVQKADLVLTGEGLLDDQSLQGKVVGEISKLCAKHQKPLITIVGNNRLPQRELYTFHAIYSIMDRAQNLEDAMQNAKQYLEDICSQIVIPEL